MVIAYMMHMFVVAFLTFLTLKKNEKPRKINLTET